MKSKLSLFAVLFAAVLALTGLSVANAQSAEDPAKVSAGQAVYESAGCVNCHAIDGTGVPGAGRPLTGVAAQEPDRTVHIASVTNGNGGMPEFGSRLSDTEIDNAVAYARATFVSDAAPLPNTGSETRWLLTSSAVLLGAGVLLLTTRRRDTQQLQA